MSSCRPIKSITIDRPPEKDVVPTPEELTELQSYAGAFNWLGTRTRPDIAYFTSLLASSASKQCVWSRELAHKVLRYLAGSAEQGLTMTASGSEDDLLVYSDAGFAGADTKSQNGLVILWAGSIITWRSSRAALSALSTAEAELCAAALGWQVAEGLRHLLNTLYVFPSQVEVMIDNKAALTAATHGATWRTRYYAVRAKRLLEEGQQGRIRLSHCPTKQMVADAMTKLAAADVVQVLISAMNGCLPTRAIAHKTSVTPGPANRGDIAGDGLPPLPAAIPEDILHPGLPADHQMWANLLEAMYRKWSALHNVPRIPAILTKYKGNWHTLYAAFVRHHNLSNHELQRVVDEVFGRAAVPAPAPIMPPLPPLPPLLPLPLHQQKREKPEENEEQILEEEGVKVAAPESQDEGDEEIATVKDAAGPPRKKRRGKKRCRPGANERRWAALEKAQGQ